MAMTDAPGDREADKSAGGGASNFVAPHISLPKGGGALRGIGETFSPNLAMGTGALSVPIALSAGRSGFGPKLSLSYDSGGGNGPFGLGWRLSTPAITRRTDKGLPRYDDAPWMDHTAETDIFLLSGAEDLVPILVDEGDGAWRPPHDPARMGYAVQAYRPRTEGLFARIERWTRLTDGDIHWRSIARDNALTLYGLDATARIADPDDPLRIFSWLISRTYDARGQAIVYDYVAEDDRGIDLERPSEQRRDRRANRYLRRIRWGNRTPQMLDPHRPDFRPSHLDAPDPDADQWLFSAVFDYDEGRFEATAPDADGRVFAWASPEAQEAWRGRADPFSTYRPGFEVRTHRLCRRVMMFHHMPEALGRETCLVKSTAFTYRQRGFGSFLTTAEQCGHRLLDDGRYLTRTLPPLELGYVESPLEDEAYRGFAAQEMDPAALEDLPGGVDGRIFRWLDLNGEGISGVLAEQGGAWLYKPNLGEGRLGAVETVGLRPSLASKPSPLRRLMDIDGDGVLDLADFSAGAPGYHSRSWDRGWTGFRPFREAPVIDWNDPQLRFVDLTGDGIADVLVTRDDAFDWRPSLLGAGFGAVRRAYPPREDEESGPRLLLADSTQTLFLADMTGDGLTDLVRVRNGEICYWPNRGYGRFGAKVAMDNAPWLDEPDQFDARRVRLADVDGAAAADLIYLGRDGARVFVNLAGNGWGPERRIEAWPAQDNVGAVEVADLLGRGTACLVWTSPLPRDDGRQIRYIDLMGGRKPHLLNRIDNHMGAVTSLDYASSTEFYLADKAKGQPWITRLPFPVHVVRQVEVWDAVSGDRIVNRYSYHHGFYDGLEREFRGFGRVDQLDTEAIVSLTGVSEADAASLPPVLTKTWFHTGVFIDGANISRRMAHEYFNDRPPHGDSDWLDRREREPLLADTLLPPGLTAFEAREACRALKGAKLRQEIYALDGSDREAIPYAVEERNFTIAPVQPLGPNRYAVFFTHAREAISLHYERDATQPRIGHELTLATDTYGNALRTASIGYARRRPAHPEQATALATLTERRFTNAVLESDAYRTPLLAAQATYQLTAAEIAGATPLSFAQVEALAAQATEIPYTAKPQGPAPQKRLTAKARTLYRADDMSRLLPEGALQTLALPGETFTLALTPELLALFADKAHPEALAAALTDTREGGYRELDGDGGLWSPSGRVFYAPEAHVTPAQELAFALDHFFWPHRYRDPFGQETVVGYDAPYLLAPTTTQDPVGNRTRSALDYRVLATWRITDPNGNRTEARFDALGLVTGTVVAGKIDGPVEGDSFEGFVDDLAPAEISAFFDAHDPRRPAHAALGGATTRFLYDLTRRPVCSAGIARETHLSALAENEETRLQLRFVYADGFGREAQTRAQAEPGPLDLDNPEAGWADPRWVASGVMIYNNKGKPVRQYEPFFSDRPQFGLERWGVSSVLFYDPLARVVATLHPDKSFEKVVFDPWRKVSYDANDTVTFDPLTDRDIGPYLRRLPPADYSPTWYEARIDGQLGPAEQDAARKAADCADTPGESHFDVLGRAFLNVGDNGEGSDGQRQLFRTRSVLDIKGVRLAAYDALGRLALEDDVDMAGIKLRSRSMDAGVRWRLQDTSGKPIRTWNSRGYAFRTVYDPLRRLIEVFVRGGEPDGQHFEHELLYERRVYGDDADLELDEAERRARNLRGQMLALFDTSGEERTGHYDFKGNKLTARRRLAREVGAPLDWRGDPALEIEHFDVESGYDALNRVIRLAAPDGSVRRATFNDASLLEAVHVNLRGAEIQGQKVWTPFVTSINYDAKGQRSEITYGDGARTAFLYDPLTFRLRRLTTTRRAAPDGEAMAIFCDAERVQDMTYVYDPVGNITRCEDKALRVVHHGGRRVEPVCDYAYDPLYRLLRASGREHRAQSAFSFAPVDGNYRDFPFVGAANRHDLEALCAYVERYDYDAVGNILRMAHHADGRGWERIYDYEETSELEPDRAGNRLSRTATGHGLSTLIERYAYDAHGSLTETPHLPLMDWDFRDQLGASARQFVETGERETTLYAYDSGGIRTRKLTLRPDGRRKCERIYVGGLFEVYREYDRDGETALERQTLHVMDDQRRIALVETRTVRDGEAARAPRSDLRFQLADHLGSGHLELDADGRLISYEEYSPYGCSTFQAGRHGGELERKRYRYIGKERDEETGFSYNAARYYAPWLARWTAADPAGTADGLNLYAYVSGNPIKYVDPSGKVGETPPPGLLADHPTLARLWDKATQEVLEAKKLAGATVKESRENFEKHITGLVDAAGGNKGSNRAEGTAINVSRRIYSRVRTKFGKLAKAAGYDIDQVHHAIDQVHSAPEKSLDPTNLNATTGNAATEGTLHNKAHKAYDAVKDRLEAFKKRTANMFGDAAKDEAKAGATQATETAGAQGVVTDSVSTETKAVARSAARASERGFVSVGALLNIAELAVNVISVPIAVSLLEHSKANEEQKVIDEFNHNGAANKAEADKRKEMEGDMMGALPVPLLNVAFAGAARFISDTMFDMVKQGTQKEQENWAKQNDADPGKYDQVQQQIENSPFY